MNLESECGSTYWDEIARRMLSQPHYLDDAIGRQKRQAHLQLFHRWLAGQTGKTALKTDLFEEAFGADWLLADLSADWNSLIGMDISPLIVRQARSRLNGLTPMQAGYVVCDVRRLSFASDVLDLIVSNSTLDHFSTRCAITTGLAELGRCLKPDGLLIVTLDNGDNVFDPLLRLLVRLGLVPYHVGPTLGIRDLVVDLETVGLTVTDTTTLIHNPRILITLFVHAVRALFPARAERWIGAALHLFERLEGRRTQYLTGCFIAAKATKIKGISGT